MDQTFKERLLKYTPKNEPLTFWKGRVALYCFLKSLRLKPGDEVILPGLTCVVVPNAILYAGLVPIYVDINPDTYNLNVDLIESKLTSRTKVIITQNTFGLSTDVEKVVNIAKKYNLITIDDCTHGYGGHYNGKPNGSLTDAAFYSSQWNKPFSTVIGGYLIVNNPDLIESVNAEYNGYIKPSQLESFKITCLFLIRKWVLNRYTYWKLLYLYRWLSKMNLILGSSQKDELENIKKPLNYEKKMGLNQKRIAYNQLEKFEKVLAIRKQNAMIFNQWLADNKKTRVPEVYFQNHAWLKYPLRVKNREEFFELAELHKVPLGDWFISPIHPVKKQYEQWRFYEESCPISVKAAQQLINLPTDSSDIKHLIQFLEAKKAFII